ncbi:unnamed protein product [Sphagnum troendelagicum]|uniref:AIR9-like A9 domain-containing protein n=1 Tax=Sphagnum troendelagicum TaxID=128251 RepID=A0ABP0TL91_9BRYO
MAYRGAIAHGVAAEEESTTPGTYMGSRSGRRPHLMSSLSSPTAATAAADAARGYYYSSSPAPSGPVAELQNKLDSLDLSRGAPKQSSRSSKLSQPREQQLVMDIHGNVESIAATADSATMLQQQQQESAEVIRSTTQQDASWVYMLSPPRSQIPRYNPAQAEAEAAAAEGGQYQGDGDGGVSHGGSSSSLGMLQPTSTLLSSAAEYANGATSISSSTSPSDASTSSATALQQHNNMLSSNGGGHAPGVVANGSSSAAAAALLTKNGIYHSARHHQHGMQQQAMQNGNNNNNNHNNGSNQLSNPSTSGSLTPHINRREHQRSSYRETELQQQSQSEEGQEQGFFSSEMPTETTNIFTNNQQDMMVMNSRILDDDDDVNAQLRKRLTEASIKEAQLISEKRILELRVAELRLAYDQMQQALVDAASKALSYRQDILEENIRLTYAVQLAEQDRMTYVQSLMPLLTEFELQPPVSDAHSIVSYIKILVQRLRSELELYKAKVKDSEYYTPYQPSFQPLRHYTPPTQSPPFQGNGFEIVPSFSLQPKSPTPKREAEVYWERGASSSPHKDGPIGNNNNNNNLLHKDFIDQEQHQNSRALVPHESMGDQTTAAAAAATERFFSDPEGDELPLPSNQEQDSEFDRFNPGPQLGTLAEESEPTSLSIQEEGGDPLPGIEGLTIVGDAVLGGRLTACGHSVNGTSLCIFQWIRELPNGSRVIIDGAGQPEYMITADDCESKVMINCVPMDEHSRQGEVVTVVANDGKSISQDPMMKDQIDNYIANNYASFDVQFQEGTSEESQELATLVLRRSTYELRRNGSRQVINEKYAIDAFIEIPVSGQIIQCIIRSHAGRTITLMWRDAMMRDAAVLAFRAFLKMFVDEQKKKKHKWLRG